MVKSSNGTDATRNLKEEYAKAMVLAKEMAEGIVLPAKATPISIRGAGRKYGIASATISRWGDLGWITVLDEGKGRGSKKLVDERDVAFIVANNDISQGKRTLVHV